MINTCINKDKYLFSELHMTLVNEAFCKARLCAKCVYGNMIKNSSLYIQI